MNVLLIRYETGVQGTFSVLVAPEIDFGCHVLELPWRDNRRNISCVPAGEYDCIVYKSKKYGRVFQVTDVKDRSYILMHAGNWAGDVTKKLRSDSMGCLLFGKVRGYLLKQKAVLNSRITMRKFMSLMTEDKFKLKIYDRVNITGVA